jgi:PPOX class probable F420-dependent enzyme
MAQLTDSQRKLVQGQNFAHFVTLMKSGAPQVTPVWVDCDDTHILINTAEGRQKPVNIARDPRVALCVSAQDNPYSYVEVRGRVVETTNEGAVDHINALARKYQGPDAKYPLREGEVRVIFKILPERISGNA